MDYIKVPSKVSGAISELKTTQYSVYGLDIETNGLDPLHNDILLIQVGNEQMQKVFDVFRCGADIFKLLDWLNSDDTTKILHNSKFDLSFIKEKFGYEIPEAKCTYLAEQVLTKGKNVKYSLDAVLEKYLNIRVSKDQQVSFVGMPFGSEFSDEQIEYAAKDIKYLPKLFREMCKLLTNRNLFEVASLEFDSVYPTVDMELNGIYLNSKKWMALEEKAKERLEEAEDKLNGIIIAASEKNKLTAPMDLFNKPDINYASPKQIKPILEQLLGKPIADTNSNTLEYLDHPAVTALLEYREAYKKVSTYGEQFLKKNISRNTGRVHSSFRQMGTDTGRYASRDPNLQNIPRESEYRAAFCAKDNSHKLIAADFSNQELRLLAQISEDPTFIDATQRGLDLHCMAASILFEVPYENFFLPSGKRDPKMDKKYRNPAKSINFGLIYGMGVGRLARILRLSYVDARRIMEKYFQKFPKIKESLEYFERLVLERHYAISPLDGRTIDLSSIDWDNPKHVAHAKNQAKNFPFQGAGASVTKKALCNIKRSIKNNNYDAKLLVTVHDEIILEVYEEEAKTVASMVEKEMIKAFNYYAPDIKMEVTAEIGDFWIH